MVVELEKFRWHESDLKCLYQKQVANKPKRSEVVELPLPRPKHGEKYIRGPIPLDWIQTAIPLGRKALNVVMAVWFVAGINRENPVKLSATTLRKFGTTPQTARMILNHFESAGLVKVDRKRGRSPLVTLLPAPGGLGSVLTSESRVSR